jgi:hypothetical protein
VGSVVTREELMSPVWDETWFGSIKTLDVHVGWLRRKLGDDASAPRYLHTVGGVRSVSAPRAQNPHPGAVLKGVRGCPGSHRTGRHRAAGLSRGARAAR